VSLEFRLLGRLEVVDEGREVDLGARKQRALLCLLALHVNRVVTTDRILDELWGDEAAGKEKALWVAISRLRSALEPGREGGRGAVVQTRDHGYTLSVEPNSIDLVRFEAAINEARAVVQRDPAAALSRAGDALALWRGAPLEEFQHEQFAQSEVARLGELWLEAQELRAETLLHLGRAREQVGVLDALHREHPWRERLIDLLMRSLYQAGQHAEALRVYDRYRRSIGDELGIEPSPELRRLEEQILLHDPSVRGTDERAGPAAVNPFKGLRPFGEDDAGDYFGRDRLVVDVIRRIDRGDRLIALVGSSGSGKSSVVRAGVVPAIRKGAVARSEHWLVAQMVPGSHPILELEAALLRSTLDAPDSLMEQLTGSASGLLRCALRLVPVDGRLLLVVDQFEELFTLVEDEGERTAFLDLLGPAIDDSRGRVIVLLTLRADFYDRPLMYPDFARRLGDAVVNVAALAPDELESAVLEPIRDALVSIEPSLLATLLTDVIGQPGALPMFQFTLTAMFDRREADVLTLEAYRRMGGIRGALGQRAEDLLARADDAEQEAARQLFLRLVTITDDRHWTRRRVLASELTSLRTDIVSTQRVIQTMGEHRLLSFDRDHATGSPTIEVAHEALLTEWPRLREWINDARGDVVRHQAFVAARNEWAAAEENAGYLLAGQRLADYEAWASNTQLALTEDERDFLDRSITSRDNADRGENQRRLRELALARRARRRSIGLLVASLLIIGGAVSIWFATRGGARPTIALVRPPLVGEGFDIAQQMISGWEQAQREHDIKALDVKPLTDPASEIARLADQGPDLLVIDQSYRSYIDEVATLHPDVWFVTYDVAATDHHLPNVSTVVIDADAAGAYLAGAAAALTTRTGVIGFLGAHQPLNEAFRIGYEAGAEAIDPDVVVLSTYLVQSSGTDVFQRSGEGDEAAAELYRRGADVVFHAAGDSGDHIPAVATEMSASMGRQLWVIGVDSDQWLTVSEEEQAHVLTSMLKRFDLEVSKSIDRFLSGHLAAGVTRLGIADGIVSLSDSGNHLSAATTARIDELASGLADGTLVVPTDATGPPSALPDADGVITVSMAGDDCLVDGPQTIHYGDSVRVDFVNDESVARTVTMTSGDRPEDAEGVQHGLGFSLRAPAHAGNAGVIEPPIRGTWTLGCLDENLQPVGAAVRITVTDP